MNLWIVAGEVTPPESLRVVNTLPSLKEAEACAIKLAHHSPGVRFMVYTLVAQERVWLEPDLAKIEVLR